MALKEIAKQLLFISRMPKLCGILQLVSAQKQYTGYTGQNGGASLLAKYSANLNKVYMF